MPTACRNCGFSLNAGDVFCGNCGQAIAADSPLHDATLTAASPLENDRGDRQAPASAVPRGHQDQAAGAVPPAPRLGDGHASAGEPADWPGRAHADAGGRTPWPGHQDRAEDEAPPIRRPTRHGSDRTPQPAAGGPAPHAGEEAAATALMAEMRDRLAEEHERMDDGLTGDWSFDPLRNKRFLGQILRRFGLYTVAAFAVQFIIFLFESLIDLSSGKTPSLGGSLGILTLLWIVVILVFWLLPVPGLLRQWSTLLSGQAPAAQYAFECINQAIDRHATPRDTLRERGYPLPGEGHRRFLELHRGIFTGFISCFPHGNDLYVGYSFWIYMSPFRLLLMRIGRNIQNWTGRGNDMYQTLRYESTRATVDAIHACTIEGIDNAIYRSGDAGQAVAAQQAPASGQERQQVRQPAGPGL